MITSFNPATDQTLARYPEYDGDAIEQRLERASRAQQAWARLPVAERMPPLRAVARVLREDKAQLARLITLEMGKPLAEALGEVEKCAWNFDVYADAAPGFLRDQVVASSAPRTAASSTTPSAWCWR
jgi:succinate-semialdehyde dehydrogenase/glutarate-semialdehyde dehydrogenase